MNDRYLRLVPREQLDPILRLKIAKLPAVTDSQAEKMLHAIGADHRRGRTYRGRKFYHAYRNYYDAGGKELYDAEMNYINKTIYEGVEGY